MGVALTKLMLPGMLLFRIEVPVVVLVSPARDSVQERATPAPK